MSKVRLGEWMWRFLAAAMLFAVSWTIWIIYQLSPPAFIMNAAFEAAAKARGKQAETPSAQGIITPASTSAETPAAASASSPAEDPAKAPAATASSAAETSAKTAAAAPAEPPVPEKPAEKPAEKPVAAKAPDVEVAETVEAWAKAWSAKDADAYLAFYAKDFKTPGGEPRAEWEKTRKQRIGAPKSITVKIDALKVTLAGEGRARATFRQSYRSDVVEPIVTTKTLALARSDGRWLIQQEKSGN
jgi:hypothetical protein